MLKDDQGDGVKTDLTATSEAIPDSPSGELLMNEMVTCTYGAGEDSSCSSAVDLSTGAPPTAMTSASAAESDVSSPPSLCDLRAAAVASMDMGAENERLSPKGPLLMAGRLLTASIGIL